MKSVSKAKVPKLRKVSFVVRYEAVAMPTANLLQRVASEVVRELLDEAGFEQSARDD